MEAKKLSGAYIVRIDKGENLVESLRTFCEKERITLAAVQGIGATDHVTLGLFEPATKEYHTKTLEGDFEITALLGNVTTMEGKPYLHLHITLGDAAHEAKAGHLNEARISATCEVILQVFDGEVDRKKDESLGLNLLKFDDA